MYYVSRLLNSTVNRYSNTENYEYIIYIIAQEYQGFN